jgi:TRAP-type C4-dicarboxylate transport system permease small subunit
VLMIVGGVGRAAQLSRSAASTTSVLLAVRRRVILFAMAHAFRHGDFVRVTLLLEAVGARARRLLDAVCLSVAAVAVAYLTWWATAFTLESYQFNEMATGLVVIPIWIPQATFVIGCWLLLATVLDELLTVAQGQRPHYQQAVEERHARGDFSADV